MRTTIELKDEHRAALLALAARRKKKGFSELIGEAVDVYLKSLRDQEKTRRRALAALGSFSDKEAEDLRRHVKEIRKTWR